MYDDRLIDWDWQKGQQAGTDLESFIGGGSATPMPSYDLLPQQQYSGSGIGADIQQAMSMNLPMSRPSGGAMVNDGFTAKGGSLYGTPPTGMSASPFQVKDSFMADSPIHTLGYSSRHGISAPSVDYSGMAQRAGVDRHNMDMSRMLGNQESMRHSQALDLQKMMLMSSDRQAAIRQRSQGNYDRTLQQLPVGGRRTHIDEGERQGDITPEAAQAQRLEDAIDAGYIAAGGQDSATKRPRSLEGFLRGASARFDPNKMSRAEFISRLMGMGYTAGDVDALKRKPGLEQFVPSLLGQPKVNNLSSIDIYGEALRPRVPSANPLDNVDIYGNPIR